VTRLKPTLISTKQAFALKELLVVVTVIVVLALVFLPPLYKAKAKDTQANCINDLKSIGIAFRLWAGDAGDKYVMLTPTNRGGSLEHAQKGSVFETFHCLSNELGTTKILTCPTDERIPALNFTSLAPSNISYFIGLDADETLPRMFLAGDRNLAINGTNVLAGLLSIKTNDVVSWTAEMHNHSGNVLLADGSAQRTTSSHLNALLKETGTNLNHLVIP
jgi:prepilin-type processing-associated H-X9-DG protein